MPAYRFCRPDDIPLLVQALNDCSDGGAAASRYPAWACGAWSVATFKRAMRVLHLWPSSCMLAFGPDGREPIAVVLGCKRPAGTLIYQVAVSAPERENGHAQHMLSSLSAKLAILGPPKLIAEVNAGDSAQSSLFESIDYEQDGEFLDLEFSGRLALTAGPAAAECLGPVTFAQAAEAGLLAQNAKSSWFRCVETVNDDELQAVGFASLEGIEACLVYRTSTGGERSAETPVAAIEVLHCRAAAAADWGVFFPLLLQHAFEQHFGAGGEGAVFLPRLSRSEAEFLLSRGFSSSRRWIRFVAAAREEVERAD